MSFKLEEFFFDTPIYTRTNISDTSSNDFQSLFFTHGSISFEGYNPWRKTQSTFHVIRTMRYSDNEKLSNGGFGTVIIKCKRYEDEFRFYLYWDADKKFIIKVGQFPTVADFHIGELKQYNKLLPEGKMKEFTRAIGLAANGVGIGSFVYLRRIFEHLISEAATIALKNKEISEEDYAKARLDEKILMLSHQLPDFLVENRSMYSILSLGVHELEEEQCLAHFDTLRVGIEIILDEKLDELRKKEKIASAKKKLASLKSEITNTNKH